MFANPVFITPGRIIIVIIIIIIIIIVIIIVVVVVVVVIVIAMAVQTSNVWMPRVKNKSFG